MVLEVHIENRACEKIERAGCLAIKWGRFGWPDRLIVVRPGYVFFIEFKKPGEIKRPNESSDPRQRLRHKDLRRMGMRVYVLDSVEDAMKALGVEQRRAARLLS